jgi:hypothetical protein
MHMLGLNSPANVVSPVMGVEDLSNSDYLQFVVTPLPQPRRLLQLASAIWHVLGTPRRHVEEVVA